MTAKGNKTVAPSKNALERAKLLFGDDYCGLDGNDSLNSAFREISSDKSKSLSSVQGLHLGFETPSKLPGTVVKQGIVEDCNLTQIDAANPSSHYTDALGISRAQKVKNEGSNGSTTPSLGTI
jgi:hypothetical protein